MPLHFDSHKNNAPKNYNSDLNIKGLAFFRKTLEKNFFSNIFVKDYSLATTSGQLTLELNCNLSLVEMLFHFNKGNWGSFKKGTLTLENLMVQLQHDNNTELDIEELTLFLKNTTIVINKIYKGSIPTQLYKIFNEIGKHYVYLSRGLTDTPYEIYIPVFEEGAHTNDNLMPSIDAGNHTEKDYYNYWALYCDSEVDAVIYDLKGLCFQSGDLRMLNH